MVAPSSGRDIVLMTVMIKKAISSGQIDDNQRNEMVFDILGSAPRRAVICSPAVR